MFKLSVKLNKKNEKLERNIVNFKNHNEFLESDKVSLVRWTRVYVSLANP